VIHLGITARSRRSFTGGAAGRRAGHRHLVYQGGHIEFFKYMVDLLKARGGGHIQVFGGGGGVIVPAEIKELQDYGVTRHLLAEDGQRMGLQGMINDMLARCDFDSRSTRRRRWSPKIRAPSRSSTAIELGAFTGKLEPKPRPVLGVTGTGGAAKGSLADELVRRFRLTRRRARHRRPPFDRDAAQEPAARSSAIASA